MGFRVVCISRTTAAGGETVGQEVAQRLGFRYVDEQIIEKAAQMAQVEPLQVAKAEYRQPLLQRLVDKITLAAGVTGDDFKPSPIASKGDANDLRTMIRAAIYEVASVGQAVIVAHAASMALADTEGVLRVLVTASTETRISRVAEFERIIRAEAERRIAASDRDRHEYFQRFYNVQEELPTHYDLVVNTDVLTTAQAIAVVLAAAQEPAR